jgi:hypothetical protein
VDYQISPNGKFMKLTIALLVLLSTPLHAETTYITIPGEGWTLKVETPPLTSSKSEVAGRILRYLGSSVETGISLSIYTEIEGSSNNIECFETYWKKAQENPVMVKASIKEFSDEKAMYATHSSEGEYQGQAFKTANGHAYFVKNGVCVDVHVSHWPYTEKSENAVEGIIKSLAIID